MVWSTFTNILQELAKSFWLILLLSIAKLTKHRHLLCNKHKWWGHPNYLPKWLLNCNSGMSSLNSLAILVTYRYSLRHHRVTILGFVVLCLLDMEHMFCVSTIQGERYLCSNYSFPNLWQISSSSSIFFIMFPYFHIMFPICFFLPLIIAYTTVKLI